MLNFRSSRHFSKTRLERRRTMEGSQAGRVFPEDEFNRILVSNVHPPGWKNPEPKDCYNLVVIGAGTAGLVTAAGAAGLGAKVALIERHLLGGDCLNVGCIPSKAIIRSSRSFYDLKRAGSFGIRGAECAEADFPYVMERMRKLRSAVSFHDSAERLKKMGVDVFLGQARFSGRDTVEVNGRTLHFSKAVIASGARAAEPVIEGLSIAGYLTNETVFSLTERPNRLAVIGGGPLGAELAQAFQRLGSTVFILHRNDHLLDREDRDAAGILQEAFKREGIELILNSSPLSVAETPQGKAVTYEREGRSESVVVDQILLGVGRAPNVEGLDLEKAGVDYDTKSGIRVDDFLRTTNPSIYAAGDICLKYKFTHVADATARMVIQNALFPGRKRLSSLTIPWVTYTDPEIAHVGMYEGEALKKGIRVDTFVSPLSEVDRAIVDGEEEGFVKVHVKKGTDEIIGATIVARHAGEMINEISLAMAGGLGLKALANVIHPYPTQAEAVKHVADKYNRTRLSPFLKGIFGLWFDLGRSQTMRMLERYGFFMKEKIRERFQSMAGRK